MSHATPCSSAQDLANLWYFAAAKALGPVRGAKVRQEDLLRTAASGMLATRRANEDEVLGHDIILSGMPDVPREPVDTGPTFENWIDSLVARASAWRERLKISSSVVSDTSADEPLIQARLDRWAWCVARPDNSDAFDRFRRWEEGAGRDLRRAVAPVRLRQQPPLPDWAVVLRDALAISHPSDRLGLLCRERPVPFESLLLPFLHVFLRRRSSEARGGYELLSPAARQRVAYTLLESLSAIVRDALYIEFCRYKFDGFTQLEQYVCPKPDAIYARFVEHMRAGGLRTLLTQYPVLARRLAVETESYGEATSEFLERLLRDLPALCAMWEVSDPGVVTAIRTGLSDPHRGNRRAVAVTFASGLRLVYKPKDLAVDVAYNRLLRWLTMMGAPVDLRPLRVLNFGDHGWVDFVEHEPCATGESLNEYYHRAGALLCVVYLLQGTDCHAENIIAAGAHPVLVDCETLLHPYPHGAGTSSGSRDQQRGTLDKLMYDSVLTTGLLPNMGVEALATYSIPGLCTSMLLPDISRNRWTRINTDRMSVSSVQDRPWTTANLPVLDGCATDVSGHIEAVVGGFTEMYRFWGAKRDAIMDSAGPLAAFRDCFVRFLLRPTRVYSVLLKHAARQAFQSDGVDYSLSFELLARAFLAGEPSSGAWSVLETERDALARGDIPFFGALTDQTDLLLENGEHLPEYFSQSPHSTVLEKTRALSEQDLQFQTALIRAAIGVYADLQKRTVNGDPAG
jgi:type 2 lantibiotic biosynthesis protein LanM